MCESINPEAPLLTGTKDKRAYFRNGPTEAIQRGRQKRRAIRSLLDILLLSYFATYLLTGTKNLRLVQKQLRSGRLSMQM